MWDGQGGACRWTPRRWEAGRRPGERRRRLQSPQPGTCAPPQAGAADAVGMAWHGAARPVMAMASQPGGAHLELLLYPEAADLLHQQEDAVSPGIDARPDLLQLQVCKVLRARHRPEMMWCTGRARLGVVGLARGAGGGGVVRPGRLGNQRGGGVQCEAAQWCVAAAAAAPRLQAGSSTHRHCGRLDDAEIVKGGEGPRPSAAAARATQCVPDRAPWGRRRMGHDSDRGEPPAGATPAGPLSFCVRGGCLGNPPAPAAASEGVKSQLPALRRRAMRRSEHTLAADACAAGRPGQGALDPRSRAQAQWHGAASERGGVSQLLAMFGGCLARLRAIGASISCRLTDAAVNSV